MTTPRLTADRRIARFHGSYDPFTFRKMIQAVAAAEREAIVAWLRNAFIVMPITGEFHDQRLHLANFIERGDHVAKETKK